MRLFTPFFGGSYDPVDTPSGRCSLVYLHGVIILSLEAITNVSNPAGCPGEAVFVLEASAHNTTSNFALHELNCATRRLHGIVTKL